MVAGFSGVLRGADAGFYGNPASTLANLARHPEGLDLLLLLVFTEIRQALEPQT